MTREKYVNPLCPLTKAVTRFNLLNKVEIVSTLSRPIHPLESESEIFLMNVENLSQKVQNGTSISKYDTRF